MVPNEPPENRGSNERPRPCPKRESPPANRGSPPANRGSFPKRGSPVNPSKALSGPIPNTLASCTCKRRLVYLVNLENCKSVYACLKGIELVDWPEDNPWPRLNPHQLRGSGAANDYILADHRALDAVATQREFVGKRGNESKHEDHKINTELVNYIWSIDDHKTHVSPSAVSSHWE